MKLLNFTFILFSALYLLGIRPSLSVAQERSVRYAPERIDERIPRQPYHRYATTDNLGRTIQFYLSEEPASSPALPLLVYIQGSSTQSHFVDMGGAVQGSHGHNYIADAARGKARVLLVEKPGVSYLDNPEDPGGAGASKEFREEHVLDRWTEAIHAAIRATVTLDGIDGGSVLVAGHSEGGVVASVLAAQYGWISHVAVLAGEGPSQLYSIRELARTGVFFQHISQDNPEERVRHVDRMWDRIQLHPESADSLFFGHAYVRWASFLSTSPLDELQQTQAAIYLASGTRDQAVPVESFDVLCAQLLSKGKKPNCNRVEGADHSFAHPNGENGWVTLWGNLVEWFLADN